MTSCSQRKIVNWKQAFEKLWPDDFVTVASKRQEPMRTDDEDIAMEGEEIENEEDVSSPPTRTIYQCCIYFNMNDSFKPTFLALQRAPDGIGLPPGT